MDRITLARKVPRLHQEYAIAAAIFVSSALLSAWLCSALPAQGLGLHADRINPRQVRIAWRRSAAVISARSAVLEISDGAQVRMLPLDHDSLRNGSVTYLQETAHVTVRMRVIPEQFGAPVEEAVSTVGQPAPPPKVTAPVIAQSEPEQIVVPVPEEMVKPAKTPAVETVAKPAPLVADIPQPPLQNADRVVPLRPLQLPPPAKPAAPSLAQEPLPAPPLVAGGFSAPPALPGLNLPVPKPSIAPQPRSGRLIWTGSLERRGVVEIDGSHATVGSLSGELPGVKVNIRISPAEFVEGGLVVYTSDPAADRRSEPASKLNGWNATRFQWDRDRPRQLVVLEAPNPSNEFKRLALRSDARNCSVIVVDWSVP